MNNYLKFPKIKKLNIDFNCNKKELKTLLFKLLFKLESTILDYNFSELRLKEVTIKSVW